MKKTILSILTLTTLFGTIFGGQTSSQMKSSFEEKSASNLIILNVNTLSENELNELMNGKHPEIALAFESQTKFPLTFFLNGELLKLIEAPANNTELIIMQPFYIRNIHQEWLFSSNLQDWKPLLEYINGNIFLGFNIENNRSSISIGAEVNKR